MFFIYLNEKDDYYFGLWISSHSIYLSFYKYKNINNVSPSVLNIIMFSNHVIIIQKPPRIEI